MIIKERVEGINKKIDELLKAKFTGSITIAYHLLGGRLMGVEFETREKMTKNAELINVNDLSTVASDSG